MKISSKTSPKVTFQPITVTLTVTFETQEEWEQAQELAGDAEDGLTIFGMSEVKSDILSRIAYHLDGQ